VDGSEKNADVSIYENLPENKSGNLHNYIFRNATVVQFVEPVEKSENKELNNENESKESGNDKLNKKPKVEKIFKPLIADVAVQRVRRRDEFKNQPTFISRIGELKNHRGLTEFDVQNYYIISDEGFIKEGIYGKLLFYKITKNIDWNAEDFQNKFPPDAVFSNGKWLKPLPK
jgi:hypothetical protein